MTQTSNPLREFFRQPAIYVRLPSQGAHWPPGTLDLPENGELPVLPMTAVDEITYRTPDALYNGQSTVSVIHSCMPNIRNAWEMPVTDFDTILIAIRIASYGHELDVGSTCPNCANEEQYSIDLRTILDKMRSPDFQTPLHRGDLEIHFRPLTYRQSTDNSIRQFEEQKMLSLVGDANLTEEEKLQKLSSAMQQITAMTIKTLASCIALIKTPNTLVTESQHILEFLNNCDRAVFNQIRDHIVNLRSSTDIPPLKIRCAKCSHEYDQPFTLDQSNFFEAAS